MKLLRSFYEKDGSGEVKLLPQEPEDMWHAYNLISIGDLLTSSTIRKVKSESSTGSSESRKLRMNLTVEVLTVDFDTEACTLRVKGRNVSENQLVKMGAHHSLELEMNQPFTLFKHLWDSVARDRIELACDAAKSAEVAAVIMQEGLAYLCLLTSNMTLTRAKIDMPIPRKQSGSSLQHDKAVLRFFDQIIEAIVRHVQFNVVKCVVLASPGFVREEFYDYMLAQAIRIDQRIILDNKTKFIKAHASSGHKHALKEVLLDPAVAVLLGDTKAAAETKALQEFYLLLRDAPDRAVYGYKDVVIANDLAAIDQLLITDALFRSRDTVQRQKYIDLVDSARTNGATVRIFSSLHVSGEHLGQLTGVAAILRFPVHIPDDDDDSDEDCGDSDRPVAAAATAAGLDSDTDSDSEVFVSSASVSRSVSADPSVGKNSDNDS